MVSSARGFMTARRLGAILSLLTVCALAPSTADAGCSNHYVKFKTWSNADLADLEPLGFLDGRERGPLQDEPPSDAPKPCTGALCSGNPATPGSTVPLVSPSVFGQWAMPALETRPAPPWASALSLEDAASRPVGRALSIFHPPRRASAIVAF